MKKVPADTLGRIQDLDTNESDLGRVIQRTPQPKHHVIDMVFFFV